MGRTWQDTPITFYHPAVQSTFMFLGEFLCLVPYLLQQWHRHRRRQQRERRTSATGTDQQPVLSDASGRAPPPPPQRARSEPQRLPPRPHSSPGFAVHMPLLESPSPRPGSRTGLHSGSSANAREASRAVFVLALPTLCDAASTMLMNVGLYYTSASVFQMLRGTVVLFAGVLVCINACCPLTASCGRKLACNLPSALHAAMTRIRCRGSC